MTIPQFSPRVLPQHQFMSRRIFSFAGVVLTLLTLLATAGADSFRDAYGRHFSATQSAARVLAPRPGLDSLHRWNQIAIDASGLDHTPVAPLENRVFGEQLGQIGRAHV